MQSLLTMPGYSGFCLAALVWMLSNGVPLLAGSIPREANVHVPKSNSLTVDLGYATYTGFKNSSTGLHYFRGMQYAAAPVGKLRWQKPQPPPVQTQPVTLPTSFPQQCPQAAPSPATPSSSEYGSEDCLLLSVLAPPDAKDLPVLVWIHGGGYAGGSADVEMTEMIRTNGNGFVYVAIQYRLGAFGFLSSAAMAGRGIANAGLWDQHAALRWVNTHIRKFGGDPDRVTISGESAGGGSVMTLVMAQGGAWGTSLFQNGIAASPYLPQQYDFDGPFPESTFAAFATSAGCLDMSAPADNATVFACLQAAHTKTLQDANQQVNSAARYGTWAFLPVTDGDFLRDLPSVQLLRGEVNGARILTSNNANEGIEFLSPTIENATDFDSWLAGLLPLMSKDELDDVAKTYAIDPVIEGTPLFATLGDRGLTALNQSSFATGQQQRAANLYAETTIVCPAYWLATAFGRPKGGGKAWHYQFSVPPSEHGADVDGYYLADAISPGSGTMSESFRLGMQLIWGNFVTRNDPTLSKEALAVLAGECGVNGAFDAAGSDQWIPWMGGTHGSPMLNLNTTGGVEVQAQMPYWNGEIANISQYAEPGLLAAWAVVDGYAWEGGRGCRCDTWASIGPAVPE